MKNTKEKKIRNKAALKHGSFAIAFTAIVIAVAVGVNIFMAILAERVNLDVDISLQGDNTLSEENVEFIKGIEDKVTLTICSTKEDYTSISQYVGQYYYSAGDSTGTGDGVYEYYEQTLTLLDLYDVYSKNITLNFVDYTDPSFSEYTNKYKGLVPGDIIVECEKSIGGETAAKSELLHFDDIYYLTESEDYYMTGTTYSVTGNNLETALTSAIYKTTSNETQKALVLAHHCKQDNVTEYAEYLEQNNFDVETFSDYSLTEIDKEIDLIIIAQPKEDFAAAELDAIDEWLANGEVRGKGLMFFADPTGPETPNLDSYLEEWGIAIEDGILYETEDKNKVFAGDSTTNWFIPAEIETEDAVTKHFSGIMNGTNAIAGGNAVITPLFEEEGTRITTALAVTPSDTVVIKPVDSGAEWKPDGSFDKNQHIGVLMASESKYHENILRTSYICVFSSCDFVSSEWFVEYPMNNELIINSAKLISGAEEDGLSFNMKKKSDNTFEIIPSYNTVKAMKIIIKWVAPLLLIAAGVVVFVRRARR